jgi:DNA-binding transcriptional LysR family regulator
LWKYHNKETFEMRSLNIDQLRALREVVEHGSFSAAARRLNLTQPAVSLQIRELERRFGMRLIERMGKRTYATAPGRELVEAARRILRECDLAEIAMRRFRDGSLGRVHIGTTMTALTYQLPAILRMLRLEHPGIELHVTQMSTRDSVERVLQNRLDFALVTLPVDSADLQITPLRGEMLVAIFPAGARDVPDVVTPSYVARQSQSLLMEHTAGAVSRIVTGWLSAHAHVPRTTMYLGTIEALKTAVAADLGMSIVPDVSVQGRVPGIIVRPLRPALPCTLAMIERRDAAPEPAREIVRNALLTLREESSLQNSMAQVERDRAMV